MYWQGRYVRRHKAICFEGILPRHKAEGPKATKPVRIVKDSTGIHSRRSRDTPSKPRWTCELRSKLGLVMNTKPQTKQNRHTSLRSLQTSSAVGRCDGVWSQHLCTSPVKASFDWIYEGISGLCPSRIAKITELSFFFVAKGTCSVKIWNVMSAKMFQKHQNQVNLNGCHSKWKYIAGKCEQERCLGVTIILWGAHDFWSCPSAGACGLDGCKIRGLNDECQLIVC